MSQNKNPDSGHHATETAHVDCEQKCAIPDDVTLSPVPDPRHDWGDVIRCPNDGCGRCFLVTTSPTTTGSES